MDVIFLFYIILTVPSPKFYVQINPVFINFDLLTVLWLNSFAMNLHQSLLNTKQESSALNYIDVKIEAIMPRVIYTLLIIIYLLH